MENNSNYPGGPVFQAIFRYDRKGRRIAPQGLRSDDRVKNHALSSHRWLYDRWNVVAEFTAQDLNSANLTRSKTYTWGLDLSGTLQGAGGVGGLLSVQSHDPQSAIHYPSFDGNGNIIAWTRNDASAPAARREYDAFGNTLVAEGTAPCDFGFSTKMREEMTGLYYYGYRFYDPLMGRWPSKDPIEEKGGVNLYGFVDNDGVNAWDYLGLTPPSQGEKEAGSKAFAGLADKLKKIAKECCKCPKAESDAEAMANSIKATWEGAYGKGSVNTPHSCGGYYCAHWAKAFSDASKKSIKGDCWNADLKWAPEFYFSKKDQKWVQSVVVHFYVKITASGKDGADKSKCSIIIDDSYSTGEFVHDPNTFLKGDPNTKWPEQNNGEDEFNDFNQGDHKWDPPITPRF